jgi:putative Mn2+ efflux pump MntP
MIGIPKRYGHFLFGIIQSGFTCAIAAAIASGPFMYTGAFIGHWLKSWIYAWAVMIPFVLLITPFIRRAVDALTSEDSSSASGV